MQLQKTYITKADGTKELFDVVKLEHSLQKAGATSTTRARIIAHIMHELRPDMLTEDIYLHAFQLLQEHEETPVAARYSMKRAVFALGPSGFPFERFLAEILKAEGWQTQTGVIMTGRCVTHEVDVLAERAGIRVGIEAKFHNDPSGKTDVKDALYVKARYDDLRQAALPAMRVTEGWLVTNTRFTKNAIRYAQCSNLKLIGWNYPRTRGLLQMIEDAQVHPLTCLTTLSAGEKKRLLDQKIVLCKSITTPHLLEDHGIKQTKIPAVLQEAQRLCGI
jgi:Holliday junction resolvase